MTDLEKAWREGYASGYERGSDDACAYEWGAARHPNTKCKNEDDEWNGSETKAKTPVGGVLNDLMDENKALRVERDTLVGHLEAIIAPTEVGGGISAHINAPLLNELNELKDKYDCLADKYDELREFVRIITLGVQQTPITQKQAVEMFNYAYGLYQKHDVERRAGVEMEKDL